MNKVFVGSSVGLALGILTTVCLAALTVFFAVNGEETVSLGPVATTEFVALDRVEFEIEFFVGWLGYALPLFGLLLGGLVGLVAHGREDG